MKVSCFNIPKPIKNASQRVGATLRRFFERDEEGATAIEFAMIVPAFFGCIGFVGMFGYMFIAATTLEDGVREAGRHIRVGKVFAAGMSKTDFKDKICTYVAIPKADCVANIVIDVDSAPAIGDLPKGTPHTGGKLDSGKSSYDAGGSSDYVMVKAYLPFGSLGTLFELLGGSNSDVFTVSSATVFRSEPY